MHNKINGQKHPLPQGERVSMHPMLAFDIETTGLEPRFELVTCVCAEDFLTGRKYAFEFARVRFETPHNEAALRAELVALLDASPTLCAFNGVQFDIPFLMTSLRIPAATAQKWKAKTSDILEECRKANQHTFSLNLLCTENSIAVKTSSGTHAIWMAKNRKWSDLKEYCEHDVHILCELYRKRMLVNPRTKEVMDLALWSEPDLYLGTTLPPAPAPASLPGLPPVPLFEATHAPAGSSQTQVLVACPPDSLAVWLDTVSSRLLRLPEALVAEADVFGVKSRFCVVRCPTCDAEGFIQEDTQHLGPRDPPASWHTQLVHACAMQHAYRIKVVPNDSVLA